ncbi:protein FAM83G [Genypterus blacodes]|uniref:protein FAM83G n=1 Tax=Genypterus blacodes TaxID=154954 RepID=UPI003F75CFCC
MARSQIQCLDDHNVNWRVSESKPEFFYSEDQRRALEALLARGPDGFFDYICENGVRGFLSEKELEHLAHTAEAYRPGHEHLQKLESPGPGNLTPASGEELGDCAVSLEYWPDRSEGSVAELDLGWPECISYRGVTRVTVYTQPPADGQTHIKEIVRRSIASAQRVIAVVMDAFTDVDIFRDLLDASYKRRIPVYIIIDMGAVPSFLSMCDRADMHRGHLKNLRVRCCGGVEFYTRTAQRVRGALSQKFLLIDGDRAISGSYSFTWSSSRLDRNLITVITGQAMETFDLQFQDLYLNSRSVSLNKVQMADEPIPDPLPHVAPVPVSAAIARKLINPKYALVTTGTHASLNSSDQNSSNKNSQTPTGLKIKKGPLKGVAEAPALHPGLAHLEKAYLIPYLPTWPEPDPPSDVIGFINIRDDKRANQVHLQRSERFEVSQAIRFSSPLIMPPDKDELTLLQKAKAAGTAQPSAGDTSIDSSTTVTPFSAQVMKQAPTGPKLDNTDASDSTPTPSAIIPANPQLPDQARQTPQMPTVAPPIPKPRTLQLVIDSAPKQHVGQPEITLVKIDQIEALSPFPTQVRTRQERLSLERRKKEKEEDSGSNGNGSQDSTKVICDKATNDNPSSVSTASEEEFFECSQPEPDDLSLPNGVRAGSGRGNRQGDGVNLMARLSQSMLDLREPSQSDDSTALIRQSQNLRRQGFPSPHRHIGQLFDMSRSPNREGQQRGPKVVIAKPGSFHRPARASGPVIGGYRYWQNQSMQLDPGQAQAQTRSGRSPRRSSPGYRKSEQANPQPPAANPSGLLGLSFSKLNNFRHLKARAGMTQKKLSQTNS